jgi:hypothetical protein
MAARQSSRLSTALKPAQSKYTKHLLLLLLPLLLLLLLLLPTGKPVSSVIAPSSAARP